MNSSVVVYDGGQNVSKEKRPVEEKNPDRKQSEETKQSRWGFRGMTVRDWLELLIVPMVLVGIGLLFEMQQAGRQQATEKQQQALAEQRVQDEALQAYLNQMSQLLLDRKLLEAEQGTPLYTLAQAHTSTLILRLDAEHNESVTRFLINSGLAENSEASARLLREITLSHATLSDAYLPNADLRYADLSGAELFDADLSSADLSSAVLSGADLSGAELFDANLFVANLTKANLHDATLSYADLKGANLKGADLRYADLSDGWNPKREANLSGTGAIYVHPFGANLSGANLSDADLRKANLSGALSLTDEKIAAAESFEGATMPNGQKYAEWLKSKGSGEEGDNSGRS